MNQLTIADRRFLKHGEVVQFLCAFVFRLVSRVETGSSTPQHLVSYVLELLPSALALEHGYGDSKSPASYFSCTPFQRRAL